jgi:hypothetical protein
MEKLPKAKLTSSLILFHHKKFLQSFKPISIYYFFAIKLDSNTQFD